MIKVYKGARYATAERFQLPEPVPDINSPEELDCEEIICPQGPSRLAHFTDESLSTMKQGEDCLRMSIFAPDDADKCPVILWVHGGSFIAGSGLSPIFDGTHLSEELHAIVINISYRVGFFGFRFYENYDNRNLGIRDVICAMRWIKRNVGKFGGDAGNISAIGFSAGGYILSDIITRVKENLFRRAFLIGTPIGMWCPAKLSRRVTDIVLRELKNNPRTATEQEIVDAQTHALPMLPKGMPMLPVSGKIYKADHVMPGLMSVVIQTNRDDGFYNTHFKLLKTFSSRMAYILPGKAFARQLRRAKVGVISINFDWRKKDLQTGLSRGVEVPLIFGNWEQCKNLPVLHGATEDRFRYYNEVTIKMLRGFISM